MAGRGRPKKNDAKRGQFRIRMSENDEEMLEYVCERTGKTKTEVVREAIRMQYNLKKARSLL